MLLLLTFLKVSLYTTYINLLSLLQVLDGTFIKINVNNKRKDMENNSLENETKSLFLRVDPVLHALLKEIAKEQGNRRTVNQQVQVMLWEWIRANKNKQPVKYDEKKLTQNLNQAIDTMVARDFSR